MFLPEYKRLEKPKKNSKWLIDPRNVFVYNKIYAVINILTTSAYPAEVSYHITKEQNLKTTVIKYWRPKNKGITCLKGNSAKSQQ